MQSVRVANFLPSVSGFAFSNRFSSTIPNKMVNIPIFNIALDIGKASNGVCGGMTYTVMDCFANRLHIPKSSNPDPTKAPIANNDPLTQYILQRLYDSFGPGFSNAARYVQLMTTIDHDTVVSTGVGSIIVNQEWPKIKADLDANVLCPLGLVPGVWAPITNIPLIVNQMQHAHQVLAWGYDLDDAYNLKIYVYDPNNPGNNDSTISLNIGTPAHTLSISMPDITANIAGHGTFRAFFKHNAYVPEMLPAGLSTGRMTIQATVLPNGSIPVNKAVKLTVNAIDSSEKTAIAKAVILMDGVVVAAAGEQFTATFYSRYTRGWTIDPITHEKTERWVGPHYPAFQVSAPFYDLVWIQPTYTGAKPPPDDPDI